MVRISSAVALALVLAATSPMANAQSAGAGAAIYKQKCAMCHTSKANERSGIGPNLAGVVGRTAAASEGYKYSPALKKSGLKWDKATLDAFLTYPGKLVPGSRMVTQVPNAGERAKLIAYLAALKN